MPVDFMNTPETAESLSVVAWRRMLAVLPPDKTASLGIARSNKPMPPKAMAALRIAGLPDAECILQQPDDAWVTLYEQQLALLAKARRKQGEAQDGVFYTPAPVARYLIQHSLGHALQRLEPLLPPGFFKSGADPQPEKPAQKTVETILKKAQAIRIIDPACGTGVFLLEALHTLTAFYRRIASHFSEAFCPNAFGATWLANPASYVLRHQLYGIDIDPVAVAVTEARLMQHVWATEAVGGDIPPHAEASHFYCGDALFSGLQTEITQWDFVVGNPPYVSEVRKQAGRFESLRVEGRYYQPKMDLCDAFTAWAAAHLKPEGQLAYVLPEYWMQRAGSADLRQRLWREGDIRELWIFPETPLFKDAPGHHSSLLIWEKHTGKNHAPESSPPSAPSRPGAFACGGSMDDLQTRLLQPARFWLHPASGKLLFGDAVSIELLEKLSRQPPLLAARDIQQGVVLPQGRLRAADRRRLSTEGGEALPAETGIFLLTSDEIAALRFNAFEQALLKPYYRPSAFQAFTGFNESAPEFQLIYGDRENRRQLQQHPERYAHVRAHLDRFVRINTSAFAPYGLHRARQAPWFEDSKKILGLRQVMQPCFAVVTHPAYVNEGFYILGGQADPDYIAGVLNSAVAWFWFYGQKRKGHRLQIDKDVLAVFPAPVCASENLKAEISALARRLARPETNASSSQTTSVFHALNACVYEAYGLTTAEKTMIETRQAAIPGCKSSVRTDG